MPKTRPRELLIKSCLLINIYEGILTNGGGWEKAGDGIGSMEFAGFNSFIQIY